MFQGWLILLNRIHLSTRVKEKEFAAEIKLRNVEKRETKLNLNNLFQYWRILSIS